jgi:hypothetical protein
VHLPTRSDLASRPRSAPPAEHTHQIKLQGFQAQFRQHCGRHRWRLDCVSTRAGFIPEGILRQEPGRSPESGTLRPPKPAEMGPVLVDDHRQSSSKAFMFDFARGLSRSPKRTSLPQVIGEAIKSKRGGASERTLLAFITSRKKIESAVPPIALLCELGGWKLW